MAEQRAIEQIYKLAEIRVNTGRSRTIEQAFDQVCQEYPSLFQQDYDERMSGRVRAPTRTAPAQAPVHSGAYGEIELLALTRVASGVAKTVEQGVDQVVCEPGGDVLYKRYTDERAGRAEPVQIQKTSIPLYKRPTGPSPEARAFLIQACSREYLAKGYTVAQAAAAVVQQYPWMG